MFSLMSDQEVLSGEGSIAIRNVAREGSRFVVLLVSSKVFCSCVCLPTLAMVDGHSLGCLTHSTSLSPVSAGRW